MRAVRLSCEEDVFVAPRNRKVVPYRRPPKINIGIIIFAILFIYLCLTAYSYLGRKKVRFFEVESGPPDM